MIRRRTVRSRRERMWLGLVVAGLLTGVGVLILLDWGTPLEGLAPGFLTRPQEPVNVLPLPWVGLGALVAGLGVALDLTRDMPETVRLVLWNVAMGWYIVLALWAVEDHVVFTALACTVIAAAIALSYWWLPREPVHAAD